MAAAVSEKVGSYLSSLSPTQVAQILYEKGLGEYGESVISNGIDGSYLEALATSKSVKASILSSCGDNLSRSLLAKSVREFLTASGESKLREKFSEQCTENGGEIIFEGQPGDINSPMWETMYHVSQSPTGSKGVMFVKTKAGGFVLKAGGEESVREVFSEHLAAYLGIPIAKQRIALGTEAKVIVSKISELIGAEDMTSVCDIQMKLWSWRQKPFLSIIELVKNAESLKGMSSTRAQLKLDPSTELGFKRLPQLYGKRQFENVQFGYKTPQVDRSSHRLPSIRLLATIYLQEICRSCPILLFRILGKH